MNPERHRRNGPRRIDEWAEYDAMLDEAERPILADLKEVGWDVSSVFHVGIDGEGRLVRYPEAVPVLMKHLRRGGYPDVIFDGIASRLATKDAAPYWEELREMYLAAKRGPIREPLAIALSGAATKAHLDDLIRFVTDKKLARRLGQSRIFFLQPIKLLGRDRGLDVIETLVDDPQLGIEATEQLRRSKRGRAQSRASQARLRSSATD